MVIDTLENAPMYNFGSAWRRAFEFLNTLTPETEDKKYTIQGEDIFAIVMSYETSSPENAIIESHREYVDIQSVIVGAEAFECFMRDTLEVDVPYDTSKDAEFYKLPSHRHTRVNVKKGTFLMLYPHDAHMAGLMIDEKKEVVKKVVVKIRKELLTSH